MPGFGCGPVPQPCYCCSSGDMRLSTAGKEASCPTTWLQGDRHRLGIGLGPLPEWKQRIAHLLGNTFLVDVSTERCSAKATLEVARDEHGQRSKWKSRQWEVLTGQQKILQNASFWTAPQEMHIPATYRVWWFFLSAFVLFFLNKSTAQFMLCYLAVAHSTKSLPPLHASTLFALISLCPRSWEVERLC